MTSRPGQRWKGSVRVSLATAGVALSLAACATAPPPSSVPRLSSRTRVRAYNRPYEVRGRWYTPADQPSYDRVGLASWYSYESRSRTTADGEPFDIRLATAAHTTLPIPSWLEVTNLDNGRSLRVRLNDRGPFVSSRILDVSRSAAEQLGFLQRGTARVRVRYLGPAEPLGGNAPLWARAGAPPRAHPGPPVQVALVRADVAPVWRSAAAEVAEDAAAPPSFEDSAPMDQAEPPPPSPSLTALPVVPSPTGLGYEVQAGAFADRANAEHAALRLSVAGTTSIRPLEREGGAVLYRVMVGAWTEAPDAVSARSRIAALGFSDAKVLAP